MFQNLRNSFLAGAYELRTGIPQGETGRCEQPRRDTGDVHRTLPQLPRHSNGQPQGRGMRSTINLITPDNGEKFLIEMDNATLTNIKGFVASNPTLTVTIKRADLGQEPRRSRRRSRMEPRRWRVT
jgi:alkyl sulfatase BDS1-like metallo-beta-lactamase superfamily hydrolase